MWKSLYRQSVDRKRKITQEEADTSRRSKNVKMRSVQDVLNAAPPVYYNCDEILPRILQNSQGLSHCDKVNFSPPSSKQW
ncbi:hypothetical protein NPIL_176191 [Nephila pilipes]|uniref:Uncharacterized protein n=1 Tax=Nephila pilipes TaxID=299642 RepID=A0A8X6N4P2_NEPPI|nr:hypothetical protein NPIL_176191 [Nephila pilipes]